MILAYGLISLLFLWVLSGIITPHFNTQINGWRRAHKQQKTRLPLRSDESNSSVFVLIMALVGGASWFLFTHMIIESRWFPGHFAPVSLALYFILAMVTCALAHQLLLEFKGARAVFLSMIFILVLPLMVAAIMGGASDRLAPIAIWIAGLSPLSLPALCVSNHLSISEFPVNLNRAIPGAYLFWQVVYLLLVLSLVKNLWKHRQSVKSQA